MPWQPAMEIFFFAKEMQIMSGCQQLRLMGGMMG